MGGILPAEDNIGMSDVGLVGRIDAGAGMSSRLTAAQIRTFCSVSTTAEVSTAISAAISALIAAAPGALDTLDELAAALGDDANFASSVTTSLAGKVTGPASAVDNAVARFDLTTGKLIQSSSVTIDDNGAVIAGGTSNSYGIALLNTRAIAAQNSANSAYNRILNYTAANQCAVGDFDGGGGGLGLYGSGANVWTISSSGHMTASGAFDVTTTGISYAASFRIPGIARLINLSGTDGKIALTADSASTTPMLQFHDATSASPALKRVGTTLALRLADDSNDGPFSCSTLTLPAAGSGLVINPANGVETLAQTFSVLMRSSNAFIIRHGNNDVLMVRPVSASGTHSPAGYGTLCWGNTSNAVGVYASPIAAGTLAFRTAAHADAGIVCSALAASSGVSAGPVTFAVLNASPATATLGVYRITDRGNKLAYPDGTNWRFVGDDSVIS